MVIKMDQQLLTRAPASYPLEPTPYDVDCVINSFLGEHLLEVLTPMVQEYISDQPEYKGTYLLYGHTVEVWPYGPPGLLASYANWYSVEATHYTVRVTSLEGEHILFAKYNSNDHEAPPDNAHNLAEDVSAALGYPNMNSSPDSVGDDVYHECYRLFTDKSTWVLQEPNLL